LGTADTAKWMNPQKYCLTQTRATISMSRTAGPCERPAAEAAERCLASPRKMPGF
jgi:hypothetical protein